MKASESSNYFTIMTPFFYEEGDFWEGYIEIILNFMGVESTLKKFIEKIGLENVLLISNGVLYHINLN